MKNTYVDIEDQYNIKTESEDVIVDVIIGNAQIGAYTTFLNGKLVGQNEAANLGKGSELHKSELLVSSVVQDVRKETNWVSVEVTITEKGETPKSYGPYSKKVDSNLDTVTYTIIIDLI